MTPARTDKNRFAAAFALAVAVTVALTAVTWAPPARAAEFVYQEPASYVADAFGGSAPTARTLWLDTELKSELSAVLGHAPRGLRVRYWGERGRTVWILDEIGKDKPITAGIVVDRGQIEDVRVLVFRESRGWEVKYPFFTNQFVRASLGAGNELDRPIDGITGATLSVRALKKVATAALVLHAHSDEASLTLASQGE